MNKKNNIGNIEDYNKAVIYMKWVGKINRKEVTPIYKPKYNKQYHPSWFLNATTGNEN